MYRIHDTEKRVRIRERLQEEEEEGSEISGKPFTYALRVLRKLIFLIALFSRLCALSAILAEKENVIRMKFHSKHWFVHACVRSVFPHFCPLHNKVVSKAIRKRDDWMEGKVSRFYFEASRINVRFLSDVEHPIKERNEMTRPLNSSLLG